MTTRLHLLSLLAISAHGGSENGNRMASIARKWPRDSAPSELAKALLRCSMSANDTTSGKPIPGFRP